MMTNKDEQMELAKLAEHADRHTDMVVAMKKIVESNSELTIEERTLLSMAYRCVFSSCRSSWRVMSIIEHNAQGSERQQEMVKVYRVKIENELKDICYELLSLLDKYLIPNVTTIESKVFYLKMKGNYYQYLTEVTIGNERQKVVEETKHAYKNGFEIAQDQMTVTHPLRLSLALNFSVFCYEILNETDVACRLTKQAFDDAVPGLDCLSEHSYKDSTLIMQLLRDNFKVWTKNQYDSNDMDQPREQQ